MKEGGSGVKTIDKMVMILQCFTPSDSSWSLAEMTERLGMPKSSLHRHLSGLEHHGILRRDAENRWRLGYRLFIWGTLVPELTTLRQISKPFLRELVVATNESAILTIYYDFEVICIDKLEGSHSVRMTLDVGTHRMPHAGASSKILMAYLHENEIQAIIENTGLPKLSGNTITDPEILKQELTRIRSEGQAFSYEETDNGAWGVATPIFFGNGDLAAGIGIAGPTSRFSEDLQLEYSVLCQSASEEISKILSGESNPKA